MDNKYLSNFLTFSARTSANQTQDIIDGKLDKRYVRYYMPIEQISNSVTQTKNINYSFQNNCEINL